MSRGKAVVEAALASSARAVREDYARHINPKIVEALGLLGYGRDFVRARGTRLFDADGREYLDFLGSYGAAPLGHNHPEVVEAVRAALDAGAPNFCQVSPQPLAAALGKKLSELAPGELEIAYLMSSGSEAVDGALKLARAATRRSRFVSARRAFHGLTFGALSVAGDKKHRAPFEPLLEGCVQIDWGDAGALERELRKRDVAAVILEPIQGEGGFHLPPPGWLTEARRLCTRYGALLIFDEVKTAFGRTGRMFACEHDGVVPDVMVVAKGLSGGMVPVAAYVTTERVWSRAYGTLDRYDVHSATFTGGALACAAALATLEVITRDGLPARSAELGAYLGTQLREATKGHRLVREVRGRGLMWGIELSSLPAGELPRLLAGQWLAVGLMERGVVTQVGTQAPNVVRCEPPLIVTREEIDQFISALKDALAHHATGFAQSVAQASARAVKNGAAALFKGASA